MVYLPQKSSHVLLGKSWSVGLDVPLGFVTIALYKYLKNFFKKYLLGMKKVAYLCNVNLLRLAIR